MSELKHFPKFPFKTDTCLSLLMAMTVITANVLGVNLPLCLEPIIVSLPTIIIGMGYLNGKKMYDNGLRGMDQNRREYIKNLTHQLPPMDQVVRN